MGSDPSWTGQTLYTCAGAVTAFSLQAPSGYTRSDDQWLPRPPRRISRRSIRTFARRLVASCRPRSSTSSTSRSWASSFTGASSGPGFRSIHLQLDELVAAWQGLADTVAERAVAIGAFPDGQAGTVAARNNSRPLEAGAIEDHEVVRELAHRIAETSELARARMDRLADLDAASQDVLVEVVRALEEQQWMVRAQLPHGGA